MSKIEPIYQETFGMVGGFDFINRKVYLDYRLKQFPALHRKVLHHELNHANDKNIFQAMVRDLKDYPKIMSHPEYPKYLYRKNPHKYDLPIISLILSIGMFVYSLVVGIWSAILTYFAELKINVKHKY